MCTCDGIDSYNVFDYDYDCWPMKQILDDNEAIKEKDFSFYRYSQKSKQDLSEMLGGSRCIRFAS